MTFTVKEDGSAGLAVEDTYAPYRLLLRKNNEKGKALQGAEFTLLLFGKLNAASSVRLKQVFQSVIQWYEAHSFGHFRQAILCGKTIMQIILHDGF